MQDLLHKMLHDGADMYTELVDINKKYEDMRIRKITIKLEKLCNKISQKMIDNIKGAK